MAWQIKEIDMGVIDFEPGAKSTYAEIYNKIPTLKVGKAFEIETDSVKAASNMRAAVSKFVRTKGMADRYVVKNRLNKFYCGRIK